MPVMVSVSDSAGEAV